MSDNSLVKVRDIWFDEANVRFYFLSIFTFKTCLFDFNNMTCLKGQSLFFTQPQNLFKSSYMILSRTDLCSDNFSSS